MKLNVLQLVGSFQLGGSERQAIQLTRSLIRSGNYNVYLGCLSPKGPLRQDIKDLELPSVQEFPLTSFYNLNAIKQLQRFTTFLRKHAIDVVQTHDFYTNVFGMAGATLAGINARIASKRETGMRTEAQRFVEQRAYMFSNAVVANSEAVRQHLIKNGTPAKKIVTIYNSLDPEPFDAAAILQREHLLAAFNLPNAERRFITIVANLRHKVKDQETFLRAAADTKRTVPEAAFILAGEGELLHSLRALAADLGLSRDVFFIGRCDRVSELLALSEVCVMSSFAEGFSNAILEYMAASRPVVATDVGGAREAIREGVTGFLVPARDHVRMAQHIIELLKDPQRARAMGQAGRRVVIEHFSCEAQLEKTARLYERLTTRRSSIAVSARILGREKP